MALGSRRSTPGPAGVPGRDGRRRRTKESGARDTSAAHTSDKPSNVGAAEGDAKSTGPTASESRTRTVAPVSSRHSITTRAIALGVVLLLLSLSYASSLRVYFQQQHDIAAADAEIAQRQRNISDLQAELERWNDPAYVKAQARERLGWVVPGEVGYRVVGPDGKPIVEGAEIQAEGGQSESNTWWQKLDGSVRTADGPAPAEATPPPPTPSAPRTIGTTSPSPSATQR